MTTPFTLCNLNLPLAKPRKAASTRNWPVLSCHTRVFSGGGPPVGRDPEGQYGCKLASTATAAHVCLLTSDRSSENLHSSSCLGTTQTAAQEAIHDHLASSAASPPQRPHAPLSASRAPALVVSCPTRRQQQQLEHVVPPPSFCAPSPRARAQPVRAPSADAQPPHAPRPLSQP